MISKLTIIICKSSGYDNEDDGRGGFAEADIDVHRRCVCFECLEQLCVVYS